MRIDPRRAGLVAAVLAGVAMAACSRGGGAILELEPSVVSACRLPTAVDVTWDASSLGLKLAVLEVNNPGRRPKLWIQGDSVGSQRTGEWAHDGFTVTLRSMNEVELARRTLTTIPCASGPSAD